MSTEQVFPLPNDCIGGYVFFKHIFTEEIPEDEDNFELFLSYVRQNCKRRKDIDGMVISTGVYFDDNQVLFKCEAKMYEYKYYLFPIRRIDAYLVLHRLAFMIHEHRDEYQLSVTYEPRRPFSDRYDIEESVRITIKDESIPEWKRRWRRRWIIMRSKSICSVNRVLPNCLRIIQSRKNFMFDWKYTIGY